MVISIKNKEWQVPQKYGNTIQCKSCGCNKSVLDFNWIIKSDKLSLNSNVCNICINYNTSIVNKLKKENPKPEDCICQCCGKKTEKLICDHDHNTGEFRGYICNECNTGLGKLGDNIKGIERTLEYLKNTENNKPKTTKKMNMKAEALPQIELIKTLIDYNESEHALKYFMQTQFNNKIEVSVSKVKKVKTKSVEEKYGIPYAKRKEYIKSNCIMVETFDNNYINLKKVFNVKDNHALLASSQMDKILEMNIQIVCKRAGRGYHYGISVNDIEKLK